MIPATYIGTDSQQFAPGTAGFMSTAPSRNASFSLDADGGRGCYVHPSDVADASQMDRARDVLGNDPNMGDEARDAALLAAAREIVALDLAADEEDADGGPSDWDDRFAGLE